MLDNSRRTVIQFLPWKLFPIEFEERVISPKPATPCASPPRTPRHPRKRRRGTQTDLLNRPGEKPGKINYPKTVPLIT